MALTVLRAGLLSTVQDLGRTGVQAYGVSVGGAMDAFALRVANLLVGNPEGDTGVEATLLGPTLRSEADLLLALGGADLGATLDGRPVPSWRPFAARAGSTLAFTGARRGCRAYLAVAGGIDVPEVLGGRGTDLRAGIGGLEGRALDEGDRIAGGAASPAGRRRLDRLLDAGDGVARWGAGPSLLPAYAAEPVVRVVAGIEHGRLTEASRRALVARPFTVGASSDRMGYRLAGPALRLETPFEMVSSPVAAGTVQLPPGGQPIVLMADRQTVGGYPRIAQVITVDLPLLAQLPPGGRVRFREVSLEEAQEAIVRRERDLAMFRAGLRVADPEFGLVRDTGR